MNKAINKFLLTGDKLMWELHLKQPEFIYSTCRPFTIHRERIQKYGEADNIKHLYRNELDKICFAHEAAYPDSKDSAKKTISDYILKNRVYEIAKNLKYDRYQKALASIVCRFFDKEARSGAIATSKARVSVNEKLAEKLHKLVIKKFKSLCKI